MSDFYFLCKRKKLIKVLKLLGLELKEGGKSLIKVIDNGDGYIASTKKITLDGKAMNVVPTLQIVKKRFFLLN